MVRLDFTSFETENNWDYLYIYDGASTSATSIGTYTGTTSPGTVTATNSSGALTLRFTSDGSGIRAGWAATISCVAQINVTAGTGGSASGGGTFTSGQSCTVTATPNNGYVFSNWTENGSVVSGAGATYTFTVSGNRTLTANFITDPCIVTTLPWSENFEGYSSGLPTCWTHIGNGTAASQSTSPHNGSYCLRFSGATSDNIVVIPPFEREANTLQISFWTRPETSSSNSGNFDFGYVTDASQASSFQTIETYSSSMGTTYVQKEILLNTLPNGARLAFRHRSGSTSWYWFVDDILVEEIPSCLKPTDLTITSTTTNSATINWTASGHGEAGYEYIAVPSGQTPNWNNATYTTNTSGTLSELDSYKNYDVYVRAACGNNDYSEAISTTFHTELDCGNGYNEQQFSVGTYYSTSSSYPFYSYNSSSYAYGASWQIFTADEIMGNMDEGGILRSIAWKSTSTTTPIPFQIYMMTTDKSSFSSSTDTTDRATMTLVYNGATAFTANEWTEIIFDQPFEYDGSHNLMIMIYRPAPYLTSTVNFQNISSASENRMIYRYGSAATMSSGYTSAYRTNTRFTFCETIPSCPRPTALTAVADGTSATLTWSGDASSYTIAHSTSATANPDNNILVNSQSGTSYTANNLTLDNDHYFWVRANCGGNDGNSNWTGPVSVHIGYCTPAPTSIDNSGITNVTFGTVNNNTHPSSSPYYGNYISQICEAEQGDELNVAITYATSYTYNTYVWIDFNNNLTFEANEVVCYGESSNSSPTTLTLNFTIPATCPAGDYRMRIGGADSGLGSDPNNANPCYSSTYGIFEDYTLHVKTPCFTPSDFTYSDVTTTTAELSWTPTGSEDGWEIAYTSNPDDVNSFIFIDVDDNTYTLEGLTASTSYFAYVRANCGTNNMSDWTQAINFTTEDICVPAPYSVDGNGITNVTFGTGNNIVNNSERPTTSPYYGNYSNQIGAVCAGVEATVAITYATGYDYGTIIWIDLNNNLTFEGNEVVYVGVAPETNPTTLNARFTLPASTPTGDYRMRIAGSDWEYDDYTNSIAEAADANPCPTSSYTVVHDYTLRVLEAPSCIPPTNLAASNITANSAKLSWTESGTATTWQICLNGDENNLISVSTNPHTLTGLSANTTYTAKVRAYCSSSDQSEWSSTITFNTKQVPVVVGNSWSDDFEANSDWGIVNGSNAWTIGTATHNGGTHSLYISNDEGTHNSYDNATTTMSYATKLLTFESEKYIFSYDWKANGEGNYDYLRVWLAPSSFEFTANQLPDGSTSTYYYTSTTPSGWISLDNDGKLNFASDWGSKESVQDITAGTYYLVFMWCNDDSQGSTPPAAVDNVSVKKAYEIAISTNPSEGGSASGDGTYGYGATATLTATANTGYHFVNWTENSSQVGTAGNTTYTISNIQANHSVVANFELNSHDVTYEYTGTVPTGAPDAPATQTYNYGATVPAAAVPTLEGYTFSGWDGEVTTMPDEDVTVTGYWTINTHTLTINYQYSDNTQAADSHIETVNYGDSYSITSPAITGYTPNQAVVSGTMPDDDVTVNVTYTANSYEITASANPTAGGTITGAGTYNYGATVTLTATANASYTFVNWTKDGEEVSTNATYSFTATEAASYIANFERNTMTLTAEGDTWTYDGQSHVATVTPEVTEGTTLYYRITPNDQWSTNVPSITNVGTLHVYVKATNANYADSYADCMLEVTPKAATIAANNANKVYGAQDPDLTAEVTGTVGNDALTYTLSRAEGENVGTYAITVTASADDNPNYSITTSNGTFTITPATVTVTADNKSKTYGDADPDLTWTAEGFQNNDEENMLTVSISRAEGEAAGTYTITPSGATPQGNYNVVYTTGTFTIDRAKVNVIADNKSKTYGAADPELTWTAEGLRNNDTEDVLTVSISRADGETVGEYTITPSGAATQGNYTVEYETGTFTINAKTATIAANNDSKTYGDDDPTLTAEVTGVLEGDELTYTLSREEGESVGNYTITVTASADANPNYSITTSNGTFTITPKAATIAANNANKVYGEEDPDLTAEVSGIVGNDVLTYELEREEGEDVDTYTISVVVSADDNPNYSITTTNATFTITPATVTVTADDNEKTYGDIDPDLTWTVEGLQNDDDDDVLTVSISRAEGEAAGTYTITPTGAAVQGNYNVLYENGTFTISRATATVTAVDNSKVYGTADPELTADVTGLQNNDDASVISYTISRAEGETVGEYTITPSGAATQGNYTVEYETGTFTITPASVTVNIVGNYNTEDYDGEEHTVSGYTISSIMMGEEETELYTEDDFTYSGDSMVSSTNAGTTHMGLSAEDFENTNENFDEVTFNIVSDGYITINPISAVVTITGRVDTVTYDGTEHTVTGYTATANTDLYDVEEDIEFSGEATASQTIVGTNYMGLTAEQFENTNENFEEVTFNIVTDGHITVNPVGVAVTIVGHTEEADYDGIAHTVNGYDVTSITIGNEPTQLYTANDFTFNGTASASRTNVVEGEDADGTTDMGLTPDMFTNTNTNFTDVTFNVTDGSITINPITATVNITGNYSSDAYDGEEHEVNGYEVTSIMIGEEETELYTTNDFTFTGTASARRTNVVEGEDADGTTNMGLTADMFANINTNFTDVTFNVTDGYQTITTITATVTIVGNHDIKDFDGEEHAVNGYEVTSIMVGEEETELYTEDDFTFSGTASAARTDAGTTNMNLTEGQFTNTNTNFSTVTFDITDGYITVNAVDAIVTIVGSVDTVTYDGTEHTVTHYTATANTDLYDVEEDFTFTPGETSTIVEDEIAATRTDVGTTYMGLTAEQFENTNENFANVTFNVTDGHITVNPAAITIIADENGKVYGAAEPTTLTATVEGVPESGVDPVYTVSRAEGEDVGEYPITVTPSADANPNYTITTVGGVFTITPATVTVTADNKSKVYGTEDPDLTWTAEGFQNNDNEEMLTVSISRAEGETVGTYTITPSGDAVQGNYNVEYVTGTFSILPTVVFTTDPMPTAICSEGSISVAFDATIAGENGTMSFAWSRNHTDDVTGTAEGTGNIEDLTLTTSATQTVTFSVIPTFTPTEGEAVTGDAVTFNVVVNALPAVTASHENVSCTELGSATLTVTNGDAPLSCLWNNNETVSLTADGNNYSVTFDELTEGDYTYAITNANNCVTEGTVSVSDPGRVTVSQSANSETCVNVGITVSYEIEGGTDPYTLTWMNADNDIPVEETEVNSTTGTHSFTLPEGEHRLALVITDHYGCSSTSDDIITVTVWPTQYIVRDIDLVGTQTTYVVNGITYDVNGEGPADQTYPDVHGCDSTIHYVINQYTLGISIADRCTMTQSSYTRAYSNTPHILYGDTIYVQKNNLATFYAYINDTQETQWNDEKMDMSYELLFNESAITDGDLPSLVSNFSISSYYDRTGQYYGMPNLTAATGEIPNNTLAFRQTANSTILHFDYFYFAAFKNIPNKVTLTGLENGTYTLKLKAELRHSTGGTNRTGIYNPYIVGRKYGHLWGGYNDRPGNREVIAARTFTIIVNETGTNPNGAPMAVNEYAEGASVMAFPNPVNDQLNLRISGMSGAAVITITDAQGKVVRTLNTELYGGEEVLTYSVADFAQGMYFINVRNSDTLVSEKFVVTRR